MRKIGKPFATALAVLAVFAVLACAAVLPYRAILAADAKRLAVPIARPVGTGQPEDALLENQLVLTLYRRGRFFRRGDWELTGFTPDEARGLPAWEATLAGVRAAGFVPAVFRPVLALEPDLANPCWDKANFWQLAGRAGEGAASWYVVGEPQSGKAVSVRIFVDEVLEAPDLEACLDAWRVYLGLEDLPGWRREQAPASHLIIFTDTCPDAQMALTIAWEVADTWSSLTFSADAQIDSALQEDFS